MAKSHNGVGKVCPIHVRCCALMNSSSALTHRLFSAKARKLPMPLQN
jgi:hypothetical protein